MKQKTNYAPDPTRIGVGHSFDQDIWSETLKIIEEGNISQHDVIENFMLFLRRVNFAKFLTHIELFKHTID